MNIGNQILNIRKENQLTQEEFGKLFHVTRQAVSNWENEKSYPDLQVLVDISNQFFKDRGKNCFTCYHDSAFGNVCP